MTSVEKSMSKMCNLLSNMGNKNSPQKKKKKKNKKPSMVTNVSSGLQSNREVGAGYSSSLRHYVRFGKGATDDSMRVSFCLPISKIGNSGTTGNYALNYGGAYNSSAGLNPGGLIPQVSVGSMNYWQASGINSISQAFSRYSVQSLRFEYRPQSTSTNDDQLVFGFSSDPLNPLIGLDGYTSSDLLLGLSESMPFAPWNAWSLPVKHDKSEKFMEYSYDGTDGADIRLSFMGGFGCVADNTAVVTPKTYGILYLIGTFDFRDFNPIVILTGTDPGLRKRKVLKPSSSSSSSSIPTCLTCKTCNDTVIVNQR